MTDFDRVRSILAAATPGPWMHDTGPGTWNGGNIVTVARNAFGAYPLGYVTTSGPDGDVGDADARAIVTAVNLAPELIAVAEAAEAVFPLTHESAMALDAALDALHAKMKETLPDG